MNRPTSLLIVTCITIGPPGISLFGQNALDYPQWRGQTRMARRQAYDVNDGRVKWITGDGGFFMSPVVATLEGTRQVVTVTAVGG